jgi:hypothetical protein
MDDPNTGGRAETKYFDDIPDVPTSSTGVALKSEAEPESILPDDVPTVTVLNSGKQNHVASGGVGGVRAGYRVIGGTVSSAGVLTSPVGSGTKIPIAIGPVTTVLAHSVSDFFFPIPV